MATKGLFPGALVLKVSDTERAASFWTEALGYERGSDNPDFLADPSGDGIRIHLDETDRTHLDLWVDREVTDMRAEADRLVSLGATEVEWTYPDGADFIVLADPDGNLFCVIE